MNNASTHLVRSAIEELKQKKTNNSNNNNKKPQPLSDKNTNNNNTSSQKSTQAAKACLQSGNKNGFGSYYFYLDNIGAQDKAKLTGRITLLGGNIEAFFSKKCTHVITSKHETTCNKVADQENIPPCNKQKSQSDAVDKAKQWNIQVWGFNKAFDVMGKSIHNRQDKKKQLEKNVLGDAYQNDKRFGPSTGTGTKDHARRPQFAEFKGNYLIVEDTTKVHRPPVIKEYTKQVLDKSHRHFPWPYLRNTPDNKSPFDRELEKEPEKNTTKKQETLHHDNINKQDQQKIGDNVAQNVACRADTIHSTTTAHKNDNTNNNNADILPVRPATPSRGMDSQMRASGLQPSMPNTQSGLSCVSGLVASQPKALGVGNTRKPVLENLIKKVPHLPQQRQKDANIELSRKQQQRKEHDGFYCENCHERFTHFKEHIKSESHQAFIKDENHFKELDLLLEKTQRPLKILETKKRPSEFALDMTDIQAPYTKMLKHSPDIHIEDAHSGQENWGKYHHVFLGNTL